MTVVDKKFMSDIFGISYHVNYDYSWKNHSVNEIFSNPFLNTRSSLEAAYSAIVKEIQDMEKMKVDDFEEKNKKISHRILLLRHFFGLLTEPWMESISSELKEIENCKKDLKHLPTVESLFKPLSEKFLVPEHFIRPHQTCYVFETNDNIHTESVIYETTATFVQVGTYNRLNCDISEIKMRVDLHSVDKNHHFIIDWCDFGSFDEDYFTTNTVGQYVFTDKEKCLDFAKEMMNNRIKMIQHNIYNFSSISV